MSTTHLDTAAGRPPGDMVAAADPPAAGPARRRRRRFSWGRVSFMAVFLGVPLLVYVVLVLSPFVQAFYYSMTNWRGFSPPDEFVWFDNYVRIFADPVFRQAMVNNIVLVVTVPTITLLLALALASLLTVSGATVGEVRGLRNSSFYRVISFFPYAVPAIVIGLIWGMVYSPRSGLLNAVLTGVGLDTFDSYPWLGRIATAMPASIFVIVWAMVGFYMVLFIAAIRGVDTEIFEAARLDGAGRLRTAVSITLPLIRDNVQTAWIYLGIGALDAFVFMQALNPAGGPERATLVMAQQLYTTAFQGQNLWGVASAMGVVLALVTLGFAFLVFLINRLTGAEKDGGVR